MQWRDRESPQIIWIPIPTLTMFRGPSTKVLSWAASTRLTGVSQIPKLMLVLVISNPFASCVVLLSVLIGLEEEMEGSDEHVLRIIE